MSQRECRSGVLALAMGCVVGVLTACSSVPRPRADLAAAAAPDPQQFSAWRLSGRLGVKTHDDAWSAHLVWEHRPAADNLRLTSPWHQGGVVIDWAQNAGISIREGTKQPEISADPDALLRAKLGFAIPLPALRYWVLGLPAPLPVARAESSHLDGTEVLHQAGWAIRYQRYVQVNGVRLPDRLEVEGRGVRLRLAVDEWRSRP